MSCPLSGVAGTSGLSSARPVGLKPGAEQVDGVDALARSQIGLLLDDVPCVITPGGGTQAQPPRNMDATTDVADGAVSDLELLGAAEPASEVLDNLLGTLALRQAAWKQRPP